MAVLAVTNTLANGQTPDASLWNTNYSDIVTWLNNRYNGTDTWLNMKVSATAANPVEVKSSNTSCEMDIDCTGSNGTPILTWRRSGTTYFTAGVDGAASNTFKLGTTALTTNVAFQIPSTGNVIQIQDGVVGTPALTFINDTDCGIYRVGTNEWGLVAGGIRMMDVISNQYDLGIVAWGVEGSSAGFYPQTSNAISCGFTTQKWTAVWATNGTVQTSHSSTKTNIEDVNQDDLSVPKAIYFNRPDDKHEQQQLGFLADDLPEECFAVIDDHGTRSGTDVYASAVMGMLCAGWHKHEERLANLEKALNQK